MKIPPSFFLPLFTLALIQGVCRADYSTELWENAEQKNIYETREWKLLLHFHRGIFGQEKSDIDGPGFFLSPQGRHNSKKELEMTLQAFFEPISEDPDKQHAQCRFPARYAFLKENLNFDPTKLSEVSCERYEEWIKKIRPGSVSLIFSSYYMNNPSSLYGHTFLRLGRKGATEGQPLLDYTVNFAANTNVQNGLLFAILGLTGGYPGTFSTTPYYMKVQKYNNLESRDLWEYDLAFDEKSINRLMMHLWELGQTSFSYYFFNKNCSYQLLPFLDVGNPTLHLSEDFRFRAIPLDTLSAVLKRSSLVKGKHYRPSYLQIFQNRRSQLTFSEKKLAKNLLSEPESELEKYSPDRQKLILDTAYDFFRYQTGFAREQPPEVQEKERKILLLMNRFTNAKGQNINTAIPVPSAPETAHPTGRTAVGFGVTKDSSFEEYSVRAALTDLEADQTGYVEGSQLEMVSLKVRYDNTRGKANLEEFTLINIKSLIPFDDWLKKKSWGVRFGFSTAHDLNLNPEDSTFFHLAGETGITTRLAFLPKGLFYAMIYMDSGVGGIFDDSFRAGAGPMGGLLFNVTSHWRVHFNSSYVRYGLGDISSANRLSLVQSYSLSHQWEGRLALSRENAYQEGVLSLNYYF